MIRYALCPRIFLLMLFSSITVLSLAYSGDEGDYFRGNPQQAQQDTIPGKKRFQRISQDDEYMENGRINTQAVENALREVERSMQKLQREIGKDHGRYIKDAYRKSLDEMNWQEVKNAQQRALAQVQKNLNENMLNNRLMLQQQYKLADMKRQIALSRLDMLQNQKEMRLALNMNIDRQLQKAKIQLGKANKQLEELKKFTTDLENDGLIKPNEPYNIEIKDGDLYINGEKQKSKVSKKYKDKYPGYFEKGNNFKLNNDSKKSRKFEWNDNNGLI